MTKPWSRPPAVRELLAYLRGRGWLPIRTRGSHQVWESPSGQRVPIPVNHLSRRVSRAVLASVLSALAREEPHARGAA